MVDYDYAFKICVIGDSGVGKTSTVGRFVFKNFETQPTTIGLEASQKYVKLEETGKRIRLDFLDIAGESTPGYFPMYRKHIQGNHCIILMYSVIDKSSFDNVIKWLEFAQTFHQTDSFEPMIVLVGNKIDIPGFREVVTKDACQFADEKNFSIFMETSAKQGTNVDELFDAICKELVMLIGKMPALGERKQAMAMSGSIIQLSPTHVQKQTEVTQQCLC